MTARIARSGGAELVSIILTHTGQLQLTPPQAVDPMRVACSARTRLLDEQVIQWIRQHGIFARHADPQGFRFGTLAALAHSRATDDSRILLAAKFIAALYAVDDEYCDDLAAGSVPELALERLMAAATVLDRPALPAGLIAPAAALVDADPVLRALDSCVRELRLMATPTQCGRIRDETRAMFFGMAAENSWRTRDRPPDLLEYVACRQINGVVPNIAMIDVVHDYELPTELYQDSVVRRFVQTASNVMMYANDLLSVNREQFGANVQVKGYNLPVMLSHSTGQPAVMVLPEAIEMYNEQCRNFVQLGKELTAGAPEVAPFVSHVTDFTNGAVCWGTISSRYAS